MTKAKKTVGLKTPVYKRERVAMTDAYRVNNQPYDIDVIQEPAKQSKKSKLVTWLVGAALVVIAISLGIFFKWASVDQHVLVVRNSPFPVRTIREHPTANGVVILNVDICKNTDTVGQVRTSFVSRTREVFAPLAEEKLPKGCLDEEVPVLIPEDLPAGTYKVKFRATYDLNLLRGISQANLNLRSS